MHIAVESAKPAVVETLLGFGADVHVRGGKMNETPLHIAARVKDGDRCALMLLKSGASPNLTTDDGLTPVHVAARHGNLATLMQLLEDGGDPLYKSNVSLICKTTEHCFIYPHNFVRLARLLYIWPAVLVTLK